MRHFTKLTAVFMLLVVAMAAMTGSVAAAESPVITTESDLDEGVTVQNFNASSEQTSTLQFETDTTVDTNSVSVTIEAQNGTHYDKDDNYADYELVEENNVDGNDVHAFNIGHDDLETVPIDANGTTDIDITVAHTYTDTEGNTVTDETTITVTLEATNERTVLFVNEEALENDDVGPEIDVDEYESPWYSSDDDTPDTYHIEDDLAIDGANTTVYVFFDHDDMAEAFDTEADSESFISDLTFFDTDEETVYRVYADSPGDATDADEDTYMLVHSNSLELVIGDEYDGEESLEGHVGSHAPGDLDDVGFWDLQSTYFDLQDMSFLSLDFASTDFWESLWDARSANGGLLPVLSVMAGGIAVTRRRPGA
ncbi:hypothetical protein [Natronosalvus amylolyticus]|uniref:hypothetical protein n=1 Tax=Natronosalvus amylolyticus TaxID=2961994 RepID=UPI0020C98450|nr:hypothetical protein [Natronosalvus amylolyticus]